MNSPVDISPNHLDVVLDILHKHLPDDVKVWVFGSRANWTTKDSSDLDLALGGDSALDHGTIVALETAFEESILPYKVDVVDLNQVSDHFKQIIKSQMVPFPSPNNLANSEARWSEVMLGDVLTLQRGFDLPQDKRVPGLFPVIASTEQVGLHEEAKVKGPGVVIGRSGSLGGAQYVTSNFWPLNTTLWVKNFKKNYPRFCFYLLKSLDLSVFNAGSGVPTLNRNHIHNLLVRLPPLVEQRIIAHVLGTLDDKITLNQRMNQTLEEMSRTLFKSWFVDFDPVRAKMDERWLSSESLPGLPAHLYKLFPNDLVDSELGEIPEGWKVRALGDLLQLCYGKALHAKDRRQGTIPVYGSNGKIGSHNERLVSGPGIVVGRKGNPGTVTWIQNDFFPIDTTFYVIPTSTDLNLPFLLHALKDQNLSTMASDSAVPGLNRNVAYMNKQIVPNKDIADEFASCASVLFKRCDHLNNESLFLTAQRDALLPKLVSGALRPVNIIKSVRRAPR